MIVLGQDSYYKLEEVTSDLGQASQPAFLLAAQSTTLKASSNIGSKV